MVPSDVEAASLVGERESLGFEVFDVVVGMDGIEEFPRVVLGGVRVGVDAERRLAHTVVDRVATWELGMSDGRADGQEEHEEEEDGTHGDDERREDATL